MKAYKHKYGAVLAAPHQSTQQTNLMDWSVFSRNRFKQKSTSRNSQKAST